MNLMLMLAAAALALGGLLCTLYGLVQRVRRPVRRHCPGPARGFRRMLGFVLPWRTLCGYDLSGRPDARTPCPECGVMAARRDLLRSPGRVRWLRLGFTCLALAGTAFWQWEAAMWWEWVTRLPTTPLLRIEATLGPRVPGQVHDELANRACAKAMTSRQREIYAALLVRNLASDEVRGNAGHAGWLLTQLEHEGVVALLGALKSADYQQRQLAADHLRSMEGFELNQDLLRVTVEGLRDDRFPFDPGTALDSSTWTWSTNARDGTAFLVTYARPAQAFIAQGLASDDRQQRLLCAAIAGWGGLDELAPVAAPILIEHLADNDMQGDAKIAYAALVAFGAHARGALESAIESPDTQQRLSARALLGRLGDTRFVKAKPPMLSGNGIDPATLDPGDATRDLR